MSTTPRPTYPETVDLGMRRRAGAAADMAIAAHATLRRIQNGGSFDRRDRLDLAIAFAALVGGAETVTALIDRADVRTLGATVASGAYAASSAEALPLLLAAYDLLKYTPRIRNGDSS